MQRQNMTTLFVSDDSDSFFVELLAKYLFLDKHFKLQIVKVEESILRAGIVQQVPTYVDDSGKYQSVKVIAKRLTSMCNLDELLMGDNAERTYEVLKHFDIWTTASAEQIIQHYNGELLSRTFIEGDHFTCADLIVFCKLHSTTIDFDVAAKLEARNFCRWFNHIQHLPHLSSVIDQIGKDRLIFPVKISKKDQKAAEKKAKKAAGVDNPRNPKVAAKLATEEGTGDSKQAPAEGAAKKNQQKQAKKGQPESQANVDQPQKA